MNQVVYQELKRVARVGGTTTYGQVAPLAGLIPRASALGDILCDISRREHEQGHPMLSAVVVNQRTKLPGSRFFDLARELGRYTAKGPSSDRAFFLEELAKVHSAWRGSG